MNGRFSSFRRIVGVAATWALCVTWCAAETLEAQVRGVLEQNRRLQEQVAEQARTIERLSAEMAELRGASEQRARDMEDLQAAVQGGGRRSARGEAAVRVTGEVGIAWFDTGPAGAFPNSEFRVDDAKIGLEAKVWRNVFAFAQLDLLSRETNDDGVRVGEFYVDVENVFGASWANLRAGRMNLPFGEEYQFRGVIANPLISHSLSDIWGIDEGVEVYGSAGRLSYVAAVQNGGHDTLRDFDSDKAFVGRVGYDPLAWLQLSASAMRTGDLSVVDDGLSEVWFGNGFFRSIGGAGTTRTFSARLYEVDAVARWKSGRVAVAAGWANYEDDDTAADNSRTLNYHLIEAVQEFGDHWYGATRYSAMRANEGYPLAGWGNAGAFFHQPAAPLTDTLRRLSVGFGYRFGPPLVLKFEYGVERGRMTNGGRRADEHFMATEIGVKF